jgi:hypothetical protein
MFGVDGFGGASALSDPALQWISKEIPKMLIGLNQQVRKAHNATSLSF